MGGWIWPTGQILYKNFQCSRITHQTIQGSNALGSQILKKWLSTTEWWEKHYLGNQKIKVLLDLFLA